MALIPKPNVNVRWAEGGNQLEPASEVQELGFVVEKPPYEVVNWLHNKHDTSVAYLYQEGFADWDIETEYSNTSYVKYNGIVYKARLQNIGKQPDKNPTNWMIAFANYQDFTALKTDLNSTKTQAGHASNLVYKSAPVLSAKAVGTSFSANSGIGTNDGYQFNSHSRDGLFHNGTNPVVLNDGTTVASFSGNINTPAAKDVVTFDLLQEQIAKASDLLQEQIVKESRIPVGGLYFTTTNNNPQVELGYGTWAKYAEGKAIVGSSSQASDPNWTKITGTVEGVYSNTVTFPYDNWEKEAYEIKTSKQGALVVGTGRTEIQEILESLTQAIKDRTQTISNVQPSIVVNVWRRVS